MRERSRTATFIWPRIKGCLWLTRGLFISKRKADNELAIVYRYYLRVRSFGMIQIRISDRRSLGSWSVDQMNWRILFQSGLIGSFELPWSDWSRTTDPNPDHLKGTHPKSVKKWKYVFKKTKLRDLRTHLYIATVIKFLATYVYIFLIFFLIFLLDFIVVTINLIQLLAAILIRIIYLSICLSVCLSIYLSSTKKTKAKRPKTKKKFPPARVGPQTIDV